MTAVTGSRACRAQTHKLRTQHKRAAPQLDAACQYSRIYSHTRKRHATEKSRKNLDEPHAPGEKNPRERGATHVGVVVI
ncbi:hypothetical protein ZHAS_00000489 [Anopheles sinensis]|uniref:Uncharacterized protein n=1 Tax=Anopheles sinensis TaxID=74873 RepID=A0A084VA71_ANOSI|nr:hypothetical protein ZHAS_00000489 [Anopheles sinensis]